MMTHAVKEQSDSSAKTGPKWFPLNVGTALALATILGLMAFLATSDTAGPAVAADAPIAADVGPQVASPATLAPPAPDEPAAGSAGSDQAEPGAAVFVGDVAEGRFASAASVPVVASNSAITNMGPTEIGYVTNFPAVEYTWERIELSGPGVFEMGWLGELNGKLVSVSPAWVQDVGAVQVLVTATSDDGLSWDQAASYELPPETWISRVVGDGKQIVAIGERWVMDRGTTEYFVFSTSDGVVWSVADLALPTEGDEHVFIQDAVMGPAGIALSVQFETSPEEQPLLLVFDQYEVVLDYMHGSFTLTDTGSGEAVLTGQADELFNWGSDGQRIFDPATGELLTTVPYEIWDRAWNDFYGGEYGGSPLPIPVEYDEPSASEGISVEYDGLIIEIDERADSYVVTDAASGDEIARGTLNYLYQGPPPVFNDPETGEVLLAVTWDEWYSAEEQGYSGRQHEDYNYSSRTALVTSADGETWMLEIVGNQSGSTSYLAATDDGFVAMVNSYGEYGADQGTVWVMADGVWSATPSERFDLWLQSIASTDNGLIGVGDGSGGPALWSSPDGVAWTSEFAIVPQDDGSYAWLTAVTADDAGTLAALAVRERWAEYGPLVIEQEKYTATFEDGEAVLRVTGTGSGIAVLTVGWRELEDGSATGLFTWENEATSISLGNGDVMVITDDEAYAALEGQYAGGGQMGLSVFLNDGSGWVEAVVDVEGGISGASKLLLTDGRIIIGGSFWGMEPYYHEGPIDNTFVIIFGTPVGG